MQILLRHPSGKTICAQVQPETKVEDILCVARIRNEEAFAVNQGRALDMHATVHACRLRPNATICIQGRLRGGKPVKVHVLTSSPNNKSEVTIDIEETASKAEVKQKLVSATGIPVEHQKVVLSGIGQLAVADKRSNIGFSSCGSTNGVGLAVAGSK
ncbi:hypothetical protein WJX74_006607 [Apatococcus lobatus]|uniref:Ubiquitin-like domain-containing protein n=1 Tax=Apatococcus lobatus TaxID=904363 RepID=A0AAW1Q3H5_9CHLO